MRKFLLSVCVAATVPLMAVAQEEVASEGMDCAAQAEFVMELVTGRVDGVRKRKARKAAIAALDATAGEMLVEFIYALPEEQLTDEVGTAWQTQCEAM